MQNTAELLPDETLWQKTKSKGSRLYILSFLAIPVSYALKALVSRELAVEDVGIMYALLGFIGLISVYNDLGLTDALQYFLPKYVIKRNFQKAKGMMYFTLSMQLLSGILIGGVLFVFAPYIADSYFASPEIAYLIKYFGFYFICINFFQVLQSFYFAVQAVKTEKFIEFMRMSLVLISVVWLWLTDTLSLFSLAMAWIVGIILTTVGSAYRFKQHYYHNFLEGRSEIVWRDIKSWVSYGFWSLLGANAWTIISQIDLQFVLLYVGKEAAAYWSNYMSLNSVSTYIFVPLLSFLFPVFTEYAEKKQYDKIQQIRYWLFGGIAIYALVIGIGFNLRGVDIAVLLFGDKYDESGRILVYSAWLLVTPLLGIINFQLLRSIGKVRIVTWIQIAVVLLHVGISYWLLTTYQNLNYIALAFLGSHLLFFLCTQAYLYRHGYRSDSSI